MSRLYNTNSAFQKLCAYLSSIKLKPTIPNFIMDKTTIISVNNPAVAK